MFRKIALLLILVIGAWLIWEVATFPRVGALRDENPATTSFMELRKKQLSAAGKSDALEHRWVAYERISPNLRRAVLVSEDSGFYQHEGVEIEELKKLARESWENRKLGRGGSTITQQLAKNLWLSPSRSPLRKIRELILARQLERELSKKRILEIYLNVVEFGERVYGAEAAARHYFGKPASALTAGEAALLAGSLPNPRAMNPGDPNRRLRARQQIILSRMKKWGYQLEREVESAPPPAESRPDPPRPAQELPPPPAEEPPPPEPEPEEPPAEPPPDEPEATEPPEQEADPMFVSGVGQAFQPLLSKLASAANCCQAPERRF
jgi:monofunctional glycosyltransferase